MGGPHTRPSCARGHWCDATASGDKIAGRRHFLAALHSAWNFTERAEEAHLGHGWRTHKWCLKGFPTVNSYSLFACSLMYPIRNQSLTEELPKNIINDFSKIFPAYPLDSSESWRSSVAQDLKWIENVVKYVWSMQSVNPAVQNVGPVGWYYRPYAFLRALLRKNKVKYYWYWVIAQSNIRSYCLLFPHMHLWQIDRTFPIACDLIFSTLMSPKFSICRWSIPSQPVSHHLGIFTPHPIVFYLPKSQIRLQAMKLSLGWKCDPRTFVRV